MDQYRMIDGKDFIAFLSGFLLFIKKVIVFFFASIKHRFAVFIATLVIILGTGLLYWRNTKVYYEAEMSCSIKDLTKKTYGEMLQKLDGLAQTHLYNTLATTLHLSPAQASNIIGIEGKNMAGSELYEDIVPKMDQEPIYINVKVSDNSVFVPLQAGLLNYLNNISPSIIARKQQDVTDIDSKIQFLNANIASTDSAIKAATELIKSGNSISVNYTALLDYRNNLKNQVSELTKKVKETRVSVEILHGFISSEQSVHERDKNLKLTIVAAIALACFAAILSELLRNVKAAKENNIAIA